MTADPNTPLHPSEEKPPRTRLIMTGGFLGAGKTTLLLRLGEWLTGRGLRVGLVTNDQAGGLVDTSLGRAHDLAVEEIAGGCFWQPLLTHAFDHRKYKHGIP